MKTTKTTVPMVFAVRGQSGRWMQLAIVRDGGIAWLELEPALLSGWRIVRRWQSSADDWQGMGRDEIVAYKSASDATFQPANAAETETALRREVE